MKPFKTIGSFCLAASALFLVTSCTKTIEEQSTKDDRDVEQLSSHNLCGNFIGLRMYRSGNLGYFWTGNENNRQSFLGNNFIAKNFVEVTALTNGMNPSITGTPTPEFSLTSECIGVKSNVDAPGNAQRINIGEVLSFKLGTDFLTGDPATSFAWYGFDLNLNASLNCMGTIQLRRNGTIVGTVPFTGAGKNNKNFSLMHRVTDENYFNEMRFFTTAGSFQVNGYGKNVGKGGPWLPTVKLFLIDLPNNVYLNTFNAANPFISAVLNGVDQQGPNPFLGRQLRTTAFAAGTYGSGDFNNVGSPNTNIWMDLSANGTNRLFYKNSGIGISHSPMVPPFLLGGIDLGETLTIKAGSSLIPSWKNFSVIEIRTQHVPGNPINPLKVTLLSNSVVVGGPFMTIPINAAFSSFFAPANATFDEVKIEGTGPNAAIGRPANIIRIFRGCAN